MAWGLQSLGELIAKANSNRRPDFAELTSVVADCAAEGDEIAQAILHRAGSDLGEQVSLVVRKMLACGAAPQDGRRVAFTGSVLGHVEAVRTAMREHLLARHPELKIADEAVEPLDGAMWLARGGASQRRDGLADTKR